MLCDLFSSLSLVAMGWGGVVMAFVWVTFALVVDLRGGAG